MDSDSDSDSDLKKWNPDSDSRKIGWIRIRIRGVHMIFYLNPNTDQTYSDLNTLERQWIWIRLQICILLDSDSELTFALYH